MDFIPSHSDGGAGDDENGPLQHPGQTLSETNHANPNIWNVHCGCSHAGEGLMVVVAVYTLLDI